MDTESLFDGIELPAGDITEIYSDSRRVTHGSLFCCIKGTRHDGHDYAAEALSRGAAFILAEHPIDSVPEDRLLLTPSVRKAESRLWYNLTGHATDGMTKVAVTGTAGKTSVVFLLASILRSAGWRVGMLTTVRAEANGVRISLGENGGSSVSDIPGAMTTPDPEYFFTAARQMKEMGCEAFLYEASSESLALHKTSAITPDIAIFTNLSREHLDSHGTMENYFAACAV